MSTMNSTKDSLSPCVRLFVDLLLNENGEGGSSGSQTLVQDGCAAVNGQGALERPQINRQSANPLTKAPGGGWDASQCRNSESIGLLASGRNLNPIVVRSKRTPR